MERVKKLKIAISHGDLNGIGYEVLWKIFSDERILELLTPVVYGSTKAMHYWKERLGVEAKDWILIDRAEDARAEQVNIIDCATEEIELAIGEAHEAAGRLAYQALERATTDTLLGLCDALVTAPINKSIMPHDLFPYKGHTQYLEDRAAEEIGQSLMLLTCQDCRVSLVTGHVPLGHVAASLTTPLIVEKVRLLEAGLRRDFGVIKPRIAVLGLNPHAGDMGLIGKEEQEIIVPAITQLTSEGILVFGPYPADGFWASRQHQVFDGILAMYHDQGLVPFKTLYMAEGVNTTLGLRIIRTSPDHGTAYDIAGKGIASADSMRAAIYQALDIYRSRQAYEEANRNPLRRAYFSRGKDDNAFDLCSSEND
ncbi:MAG: 4-hydroxythreonine-4-phosphate dehydrogenase PdxA [Porphyromonadaceae bacterium]|nr:4-hydroxythreonine-4-phosphate dehydrogenase PdxA [Porphyromonadaceae bacterium]